MGPILVKNAERMMTSADLKADGITLIFADGCKGLIPFADLPDIQDPTNLDIELPNPYELILRDPQGRTIELPWDFVRHYCDEAYRPRVEAVATAGRQSVGNRVRQFREAAGMTQERLAGIAGIGRVTLVRIEKGEQSPRYETMVALAKAMGRPVADLLVRETTV